VLQSFSIGHVRGIDLRVHPTFGIVLLWVIYNFGIAIDGNVGTLAYGFVLMALVFGCVVLHELGHSFMAQEYGIRVRNITVFPFGGAAIIEQMPMRPRSEFMITIAGPAVNVAIAAALLPLLFLFGVVRGYDSFGDYLAYLNEINPGGLVIYLFFANVLIVLFNLLPAFPMDGGRLLRAGLTALFGRERATSAAVIVGMLSALALAIFGIWIREFLLPVIAIFVIVAAYGEGKSVRLESAMRRLRVGQFALWDSGGISPALPLAAALRGGPRDMVVTEGGQVVGMLWRKDVLRALNGGAGARTVADVMDPFVMPVDVDASVYDVQQQMHAANRWAVPIVDDGSYRGIFTVDRFVHVYRYLNAQSPQRRRVAHLREHLENAFREVR
jgi:Zn-dependent protease